MVDAIERAVPFPQHQIFVNGAPRRKILGQHAPLTPRGQHVEDRIDHPSEVHRALSSGALRWWDQRFNEQPFRIRHVTQVSHPFSVV